MRKYTLFTLFCVLSVSAIAHGEGGAQVVASPGLAFGDWGERVELDLPPAPRDVRPTIALVASHHSIDTEVGTGWRLEAGASVIRRRSSTNAVPPIDSDLAKSRFFVDGMELVSVADPGTQHYQPETYDGSRFDYHADTNTWTRKRDGWVWTYGETGNEATRTIYDPPIMTLCSAPCNTESWFVRSIVDPWGNRMDYSYIAATNPSAVQTTFGIAASKEVLVDMITYGNGTNVVKFVYDTRPDLRVDWGAGIPIFRNSRLREIWSSVGTQIFSHYYFQYVDQGPGSPDYIVTHNTLGTLTDCNNAAVTYDAAPAQSLLRKIHRYGSSTVHEVTRCNTYYKATSDAAGWADEVRVDSSVTGPPSVIDPLTWSWIPVSTDLDGDGRTDLIITPLPAGPSSGALDHRVYIATPNLAQPFTGSTGNGSAAQVAADWQARLIDTLDGAHYTNKRGHAIVDLDGDGRPEFVWENGSTSGGGAAIEKYDPQGTTGNHHFAVLVSNTANTLDRCDVRFGQFIDVDGDHLPDLVVRAHDDDGPCNATTSTRWLKNLGQAPWFDSSGARPTLDLPLERSVKPDAWNTAAASCPTLLGAPWIRGPSDINAAWTMPEAYIADQARFDDFNGDGIADVAYALWPCWTIDTAQNPQRWVHGGSAVYSRIFYGNGRGGFVDSGQSAGPPVLIDSVDYGQNSAFGPFFRITSAMLATADFDRDGHPEFLQTKSASTPWGIGAYRSRSITAGFGIDVSTTAPASQTVFQSVHPGWDCDKHSVTPSLGDYDGDGFADLLAIDINTEPGTGPGICPHNAWCVTLRRSNRDIVEGRMIATDNEHGGRTRLTWGFSSQLPNKNPDLAASLEVIQKVDGPGGSRSMAYQDGVNLDDRFAGFGEATITNDRGGVETYSFIQAKYALGAQHLGVRYRESGTIEHVSVSIHGVYQNGFAVDLAAPYFDPVIRDCEFDAGQTIVNLDTVDSQCMGLTWMGATEPALPSSHLLTFDASTADLAMGRDRYANTTERRTAMTRLFGAVTPPRRASAYPTTGSVFAAVKQNVVPTGFLSGYYRWPVPSALSGAIPDVQGIEAAYQYSNAWTGTPPLYAYDWGYDDTARKLVERYEHRDTSTTADDRRISMIWDQPYTNGYWYRLISQATYDASNHQLSATVRAGFSGFDDAGTIVTCGTNTTDCTTNLYTFTTNGALKSHQFPDGLSETWTRQAGCGEPLTHTDASGRVATFTRDARCVLQTTQYQGSTTTFSLDALNRPIKTVVDPGAGISATGTVTRTYYYDDDLAYQSSVDAREDATYSEPRRAERRSDGQLDLFYEDGLGRVTKHVRCTDSKIDSTGGALPGVVACKTAGQRVLEWNLFGSDGLKKITAEPFTGTVGATSGFGHDGQNRVIVAIHPAHTAGTPAWLTDKLTYSAGSESRTVTTASGVSITRSAHTTLSSSVSVDGVVRQSTTYDALGYPVIVTAADGTAVGRLYDTQHRLLSELKIDPTTQDFLTVTTLDPNGNEQLRSYWHTVMERDARGRITKEVFPDGSASGSATLTYSYDGADRLLTQSLNGHVQRTAVYTAPTAQLLGRVTVTDNESGAQFDQWVDGLGRVLRSTGPQADDTFVYDATGQVVRTVDGNGLVTTLEHDKQDFVTAIVDPRSGRTTFTRDGAGRMLGVVDADAATDTYSYTYAGDLSQHYEGYWLADDRSYDPQGRVVREIDHGVVKTMDYDGLGRLLLVREAPTMASELRRTSYSYDAGDRVVSIGRSPVAGFAVARTNLTYDSWGRPATMTDALGKTSRYTYDAADRLQRVIDPLGGTLLTTYDDHGRVTGRQRAGAGWEHYTYAGNRSYGGVGALWEIDRTDDQDAASAVKTQSFVDATGHPVAEVARDGTVRKWTYSFGRLVRDELDAAGSAYVATDFAYDTATGRLATSTHGPAKRYFYYTAAGRPFETVTEDDILDRLYVQGRLDKVIEGGVTRKLLRDDTYGIVVGENRSVGSGPVRNVEIGRDGVSRIARLDWSDGAGPHAVQTFTAYDYYDHAWLTTNTVGAITGNEVWTYDIKGRPLGRTTNGAGLPGKTTAWSWYDNDVLASVTTPSGATLSYDYGPGAQFDYQLDKVKLATPSTAAAVVARVDARDLRGAITQLALPSIGLVRTVGYDTMGRLASQTSGPSLSVTNFSRTASYKPDGRLATETINSSGSAPWTNTYSYDGAGRLLAEISGPSATSYAYTLDDAGNRTGTTATTGGVVTTPLAATYHGGRPSQINGVTLSYDSWNAVATDHHGNIYHRSADGELDGLGSGATATGFVRDAEGLPIAAAEPGAVVRRTTWGLSAAGLPLEVDQGDGNVLTYLNVEGIHVGTLTNGALASVNADARDSELKHGTQLLGTASGDGEGTVVPTGTDERFLYGMLERVPTAHDVMLARHRTYDPLTARFLEPDPIGSQGGDEVYHYGGGDPINTVDPMGTTATGTSCAPPSSPPQLDAHLPAIYLDTKGPGFDVPNLLEQAAAEKFNRDMAMIAQLGSSLSKLGPGSGMPPDFPGHGPLCFVNCEAPEPPPATEPGAEGDDADAPFRAHGFLGRVFGSLLHPWYKVVVVGHKDEGEGGDSGDGGGTTKHPHYGLFHIKDLDTEEAKDHCGLSCFLGKIGLLGNAGVDHGIGAVVDYYSPIAVASRVASVAQYVPPLAPVVAAYHTIEFVMHPIQSVQSGWATVKAMAYVPVAAAQDVYNLPGFVARELAVQNQEQADEIVDDAYKMAGDSLALGTEGGMAVGAYELGAGLLAGETPAAVAAETVPAAAPDAPLPGIRPRYGTDPAKIKIKWTDKMAANPGHAQFLRKLIELAQESSPLEHGVRPAGDAALRSLSRDLASDAGVDLKGTAAMHPIDSCLGANAPPDVFHMGDASVNASFGAQSGRELRGIPMGAPVEVAFEGFPSYADVPAVQPPTMGFSANWAEETVEAYWEGD